MGVDRDASNSVLECGSVTMSPFQSGRFKRHDWVSVFSWIVASSPDGVHKVQTHQSFA